MISLKTLSFILLSALVLTLLIAFITQTTVCLTISLSSGEMPCFTSYGWPLEFVWPSVLSYPLAFIINYLFFLSVVLLGYLGYQLIKTRT